MIGLPKVKTQNLLFTFTWNVKKAQNNFVPIFNSKVGVRLIHECDLYSSKYGNSTIEHYLWSISPKGYLKITTALQGSTSSNCGQFCLYYSYFRARNFGMQCIVNSLTLDHAFNDYIVDHFVANYLN